MPGDDSITIVIVMAFWPANAKKGAVVLWMKCDSQGRPRRMCCGFVHLGSLAREAQTGGQDGQEIRACFVKENSLWIIRRKESESRTCLT